MEKYRLVQEHKAEGDSEHNSDAMDTTDSSAFAPSPYPEVRITQQGKPRNYISYAMSLFVSANA